MKKIIKTLGFTLLIILLFNNCTNEYKDQGLKHPSQLHNIIIVGKYKLNNWDEVLLYYNFKDSTFNECRVNICYKDMFNVTDTIK